MDDKTIDELERAAEEQRLAEFEAFLKYHRVRDMGDGLFIRIDGDKVSVINEDEMRCEGEVSADDTVPLKLTGAPEMPEFRERLGLVLAIMTEAEVRGFVRGRNAGREDIRKIFKGVMGQEAVYQLESGQ